MTKGNAVTIITLETPENFDHTEVRFKIKGTINGFGYIGKATSEIGLIKCPVCDRENYGPMVASGECAFCNFNANNCEVESDSQV